MALNIADLIAARAATDPERPALLHSGAAQSYGELLARADAIAARLRPLLHGRAPRVALMCPNGPDYVALALGVLRAGACLVPVAGELAVPERAAQLALTAPQVMPPGLSRGCRIRVWPKRSRGLISHGARSRRRQRFPKIATPR